MHGVHGPLSHSCKIRVRGQVQGVGFRPFVWQIAKKMDIRGEVLNDPEGVLIHADGEAMEAFVGALKAEPPPLARVDAVEVEAYHFDSPPIDFEIVASKGSGAETRVTPDAATCADCLADIRGKDPRRRGYAFTNCTHCGPRFTILRALPYDRARTTMAPFEMCGDCAVEYADPADRRFHAQPVACANCGPQLKFGDSADPIAETVTALREGHIIAIKGLGGFHLCCDATNEEAIAALRGRKRRPTKPLALMGAWKDIEQYAVLTPEDRVALSSPAAPIVLLSKSGVLPDALAPGQGKLGWMLPYTPLHHLLMDNIQRPLVMTSGNLSGEPQVIGNDEAEEKLADIVDGFLTHNRKIARRLDDSVMQNTTAGPMILRRARGLVPETLPLPPGFEDAPQVTAFGAHLKSAICLIKNGQALLSHHLGDLDEALTWDEFVKADADYADLFDHAPEIFACDLHPGYRSSQHAATRAGGAPVEIQHHHAHLSACLAENAWRLDAGPVAGVILDGLGLGSDGTIWGGEVLLGDYHGFERHAWLKPTALLGGDAASREPWRNAVARLDQAGLQDEADRLFRTQPLHVLRQAANKGVNAPLSSSAGRLFDACAAVLGLAPDRQSFEGEAAMTLEALALEAHGTRLPGYELESAGDEIDPGALWQQMLTDVASAAPLPQIAYRFHATIAAAFARPARALVESGQAKAVVLSGGCFQNAVLLEMMLAALSDLPVLHHTKVPANDGGLALGQAVIAAASHLNVR